MKIPRNIQLPSLNLRNRQPGSSLLGLAFDGNRIEGVQVHRTNGSVEIQKSFVATLSLDLLTNAPELVGREIRKVLDEQGVRERWCTVCIPLTWALTLSTKLPDLPEQDLASFLQLEAERGFPYGQDALLTVSSRFRTPNGEAWATLVAVPRTHLTRLEAVLNAAQLRAASFSLGIAALQPASAPSADGVLALIPGRSNIGVQLTLGGGIALLRTIEGAFDPVGAEYELQSEHVLREVRITLRQLSAEWQDAIKVVRVFGGHDDSDQLVEVLGPRLESEGLRIEQARLHSKEGLGLKLPVKTPISEALALAVTRLAGGPVPLEFLPPKVSAWQQFSSNYSSPKLVASGATAGALAAAVLLAFFVQQVLLWYWGHRWGDIKDRVVVLDDMQSNIRKFRPWYDKSFRELSILRSLTEAFPEDGSVSAKQIEIRDADKPGELLTVTCTGTARTRSGLLKVKDKIRSSRNVVNVHTEQERGTSPMEFTFNFQWNEVGP